MRSAGMLGLLYLPLLRSQDGDISPGIAAGLFVAVKQGALQATAENLRTVIAIGALVLPVCNLVFRTNYQNRVRAPEIRQASNVQWCCDGFGA